MHVNTHNLREFCDVSATLPLTHPIRFINQGQKGRKILEETTAKQAWIISEHMQVMCEYN